MQSTLCLFYGIWIQTLTGWFSMANNFKFIPSRIRDRIHLKLYGDFDGSSACELINFLKNFRNGCNQIFINTNNLNTIHPFGMDVFIKSLGAMGININNIIITGKNRFSLKQRWCWLAFKLLNNSGTHLGGAKWTIRRDSPSLSEFKKRFKIIALIFV